MSRRRFLFRRHFALCFLFLSLLRLMGPAAGPASSAQAAGREPFVAVMQVNGMILPGTQGYLEHAIAKAEAEGASLLVMVLNTPGGVLSTTQQMVEQIFKSPVPIVIYVAPSGATAASAGVFITLAGHVAAMAPGTSIGAAHPVAGDGRDIEGDMRTKAENITIAMMKSISDQRGRNAVWAEKSVKESSSATPSEALELKVIDLIAGDLDELLRKLEGRKVSVGNKEVTLENYEKLPRLYYEMEFKNRVLNLLANPNIAALLWLGATTGLTLELYNPGAIIPGVVGIICLLLALGVSQILPISSVGVMLIVVGALLVATELYVASGILGLGGVVAMVFGAIYLIDETLAPGMGVTLWFVIPIAVVLAGLMLATTGEVVKAFRRSGATGKEGMVGAEGRAVENLAGEGRVFVQGEYWRAVPADAGETIVKDDRIEVVKVRDGLVLEVRKK